MTKRTRRLIFISVLLPVLLITGSSALAQLEDFPPLHYQPVPGFLTLPPDLNFGEVSGVALNSLGHIFVFHRGSPSLLEFDSDGHFIRSIGEGLFTKSHGLRIDAVDNIWTTDVGAHTVLKFSPEGQLLMVLGKKGMAGEWWDLFNYPLFERPSDVAFGKDGEIYISDGYGNSRVMKFDREGNFIKTWGSKGTAPGEFDLPHSIVIDAAGRVYVGDRSNRRVQIFDSEGNFIEEWTHIGAPYGLCISPDNFLFLADGINNRILKLTLEGKILGAFGQPGKGSGQLGLAHDIAVGPGNEIYVAEILNWRVQKFVPR